MDVGERTDLRWGGMSTLFDLIAGGRPEHVVKGALLYVLRRSPNLLTWISRQCGRTDSLDVGRTEILAEVPTGEHGWRADLVIAWPTGGSTSVELKLGAPFTQNQLNALAAGEIDLVIAPDLNLQAASAHRVKVVAWKDVVLHASMPQEDPACAAAVMLLAEASEAYGWYRDRISYQDLHADAAAMFDGQVVPGRSRRDWIQSYRFLYQVDAYLRELVPERWRYRFTGERISKPNKTYEYYGFNFRLAPKSLRRVPEWWLGLNRIDGELGFRLYVDDVDLRRSWSVSHGLLAREIVQDAIETIRNHHA